MKQLVAANQYFMVESDKIDDRSWIGAIQMAMPVFAKLGVVHRDTSYFRKMHEMHRFTKTQQGDSGLYNRTEHLRYRDRDFDPPYATPSGQSCYWSRGNGWALAAPVRVLDVISDTLEYREEYLTTFKEMAAALITVQREDGFWNPSLFDPDHYGSKETSGTAFFTYGLVVWAHFCWQVQRPTRRHPIPGACRHLHPCRNPLVLLGFMLTPMRGSGLNYIRILPGEM